MSYRIHDQVPEYKLATYKDGFVANHTKDGPAVWAGPNVPPAVGSIVKVRMNSLGFATVKGYFADDNFLGIRVVFHDAPDWHVRQNGRGAIGHVFGPEFDFYAEPMQPEL